MAVVSIQTALGRSRRKLLGFAMSLGAGAVGIVAINPLERLSALSRTGNSAPRSLAGGLAAFRTGDYARAARAFRAVDPQDPQRMDALILRGMALRRQERLADAIDVFSEALALAPERSAIYLYRGEVLAVRGETEQAAHDFDQAIRFAQGDQRAVAAARFQKARLHRA